MEIVDLNRDVTEPGADIDPPILRAVHQLKRDYLLAWELEHGQTRVGPQINPADMVITERGVEGDRRGQIRNPVRNMESPHVKSPRRIDVSPAAVKLAGRYFSQRGRLLFRVFKSKEVQLSRMSQAATC